MSTNNSSKGGGPEKRAFHNGRAPQMTRRAQLDEEEAGPSHRGKPNEAGPHPTLFRGLLG
jgi:hypothetical protein